MRKRVKRKLGGIYVKDFRESKLLVFRLGMEEFGISIHQVRSIEILGAFRTVPQLPDYICGIVDLRGSIIPIVDLQFLLTNSRANVVSEGKRMVVLQTLKGLMGFTVDDAKEVIDVTEDMLQETSIFVNGTEHTARFAKIGKQLISVLDVDEMLLEKRFEGSNGVHGTDQELSETTYV
ncbi:chemotaxis protein CheW [Brevibacillus migulae]|uniref:chemotaxis protein CheW n=1 Tax=Brevibacillus migulae TaxID=1644114 RepID=UPI00106E115F|nr:chemotaxis protein CheW [Brevibacillus migulae]